MKTEIFLGLIDT